MKNATAWWVGRCLITPEALTDYGRFVNKSVQLLHNIIIADIAPVPVWAYPPFSHVAGDGGRTERGTGARALGKG